MSPMSHRTFGLIRCQPTSIEFSIFIIILIIVSLISGLLKYKGVKAFVNGVKPAIIGLILATSVTLFISVMFGLTVIDDNISNTFNVEYKNLIIFALILLIVIAYKKIFKKKINPILLILISGILGIILYI